ncbi:MAG: hypothetical protein LBR10_12670 [Prevotellaceae bacterium]|jgi:hypothetical protein|nr:hypothetical protein [Prevotellaceae bacterium]
MTIKTLIFLIPVIAAIVLLAKSNLATKLISNIFIKKPKTVIGTNEYDEIISNEAIRFAREWRGADYGEKQSESVFCTNGEIISRSKSYITIWKEVFK